MRQAEIQSTNEPESHATTFQLGGPLHVTHSTTVAHSRLRSAPACCSWLVHLLLVASAASNSSHHPRTPLTVQFPLRRLPAMHAVPATPQSGPPPSPISPILTNGSLCLVEPLPAHPEDFLRCCSFAMGLLHDNTKSILAPKADFGNDCGLARLADTLDSPIGRWKVLAACCIVDIYVVCAPACAPEPHTLVPNASRLESSSLLLDPVRFSVLDTNRRDTDGRSL